MSIINSNLLLSAPSSSYSISRSLRFNSSDSAYCSRTPSTAGNRKTWTWSGWVKRSAFTPSSFQTLFCGGSGGTSEGSIRFNLDDTIEFYDYGPSAYNARLLTAQVFRDTSAWYHIVAVFNSANATADQRMRLYINGSEITTFTARTNPTQNYDGYVNNSSSHTLGDAIAGASPRFFNGYLAEVQFIDGQALTPNSFAGTNAITGQWEPREYTGSYGTNGFRLNFSDNSATTSTTLGKDAAGSNNWTPNNFSVTSTATFSGSFDGNDSISVANAEPLRVRTGDFTIEFWVRFNALSGYQTLFEKGYTSAGGILLQTPFNSGNIVAYLNGSTLFTTTGTVLSNTWYHYALVRSGTTVTMYRNGVSVGSGTSSADFSDASTLYIGGSPGGGGYYTNGYISNFRLVKGTAVYTSSFTPPTSQLTAITNTSLLTCHRSTFIDSSTNAYTVTSNGALTSSLSPFGDPSGNDSMVDTPTSYGTDTGAGGEVRGNYAIFNPLLKATNTTLSNGNLDFVSATAAGAYESAISTIGVSSGKWYAEFLVITGGNDSVAGVTWAPYNIVNGWPGGYANSIGYEAVLGKFYKDGVGGQTVNTYGVNDVIGVALDLDNAAIWFSKNGTWQGTGSPNPATNTSPAYSSLTAGTYFFAAGTGGSGKIAANFGQRPFAYTAPSGFKALCDTNLPAPVVAKPSTVMDVKLYTGNGSTQTISGLGFSPDFVWIKSRNNAWNNVLYDSVRGAGATKALVSNAIPGEGWLTSSLNSFDATGFTLGADGDVNYNTGTFAAWCWDAGSSTVTNTSGTISSQVRANASAGFSIVTYTGNGVNGATVGHGLGVAPAMVIYKIRNATNGWGVFHSSATGTLQLNSTAAQAATRWGVTSVGASVFTVDTDGFSNSNASSYLAYCFAPVAGYSTFGSYTGNNSSAGPFIYTGFKPRWLMIKRTNNDGDWVIIDGARNTANPADLSLAANLPNAERGFFPVDLLSNGFRPVTADTGVNNGSYIYAAFAEGPFQYARAR